jgi:hypothetical protein
LATLSQPRKPTLMFNSKIPITPITTQISTTI